MHHEPHVQKIHDKWDLMERGWKVRLLRFAVPLHPEPSLNEETREEIWLEEEQRAPDFLELFYDLVIVAVLSVFSTAHEVSSSKSVIVYFSYFVIIWWVWASQTLYDVHFQANDWLHRIFKCAQLATFAFVGATAANFNPFEVMPSGEETTAGIEQDSAANSFRGVAAAYAVGRLLLVMQYILVALRLVKANWRLKNHPHMHGDKPRGHFAWILFPCFIHLVSATLWFVGAFILSSSEITKLTLPYFGLALEFCSALVLPLFPGFIDPPASIISERFGALTLVILGEGIIGLVRSFSFVIAGFGFTNMAYLQCLCALVIVFACWHFLFHGLSSKRPMKRERGALWLILHLPLHFCILLLFAGMRNVGTYSNVSNAIGSVSTNLDAVYSALLMNDLSSVQEQNQWMTSELGKLDLDTPWPDEVALLNQSVNDVTIARDGRIELLSYVAEVCVGVTESFEIELSDDVMNIFDVVANFNDTMFKNTTLQTLTLNNDTSVFDDFFTAYNTELAQGVLFFLPSSGGVLLLAALLILLRAKPLGAWMWAYWVFQVVIAVGLCLLGLLNLGDDTYQLQGVQIITYQLLASSWMLPTVAITYAAMILIEYITLVFAKWTDHSPAMAEESSEKSEGGEREDNENENENEKTRGRPSESRKVSTMTVMMSSSSGTPYEERDARDMMPVLGSGDSPA